MKTLLVLLGAVSWTVAGWAENVVALSNGRVLRNAWLLAVGPQSIVIWHGGTEEEIAHSELLPDYLRTVQPMIDEVRRMAKEYQDQVERARQRRLVTLDGTTYEGVSLLSCDAVGIRIRHFGGVAAVPLSKLPEDVREAVRPKVLDHVERMERDRQELARMGGLSEWERVRNDPKGIMAHSLAGFVVEQKSSGVVILRTTVRPDITPGVNAFILGVTGKKPGANWSGKVQRSGTVEVDGKNLPQYVPAR